MLELPRVPASCREEGRTHSEEKQHSRIVSCDISPVLPLKFSVVRSYEAELEPEIQSSKSELSKPKPGRDLAFEYFACFHYTDKILKTIHHLG